MAWCGSSGVGGGLKLVDSLAFALMRWSLGREFSVVVWANGSFLVVDMEVGVGG